MGERSLHRARIVSSIAAFIFAIACGSNYGYSAWAPQFAERLKLSSTQSNLIGLSGNLGMYTLGLPMGMIVDKSGAKWAATIGIVLTSGGYFPIWHAYQIGEGSVLLLSMAFFSVGLGGCTAFVASVKISAMNWPTHRGTATALPLAAFGLSAFFFSFLSHVLFPGNTGDFLFLLSIVPSAILLVSVIFLRVVPTTGYSALPTSGDLTRVDSNHLTRISEDGKKFKRRNQPIEPGKSSSTPTAHPEEAPKLPAQVAGTLPGPASDDTETSSLLSDSSSLDLEGPVEEQDCVDRNHAQSIDIRGLKLLVYKDFWLHFIILGFLAGTGLMTINNIGNDANALWTNYDPSKDTTFISKRQAMHVALISIGSCCGRLISGIGADILVRHLGASRTWCETLSATTFMTTQLLALTISNPNFLFLVSSGTGLAYGFLFGGVPSIVAEIFGVNGLSQNWGLFVLSPVLFGNVLNLIYGRNYDSHSTVHEAGHMVCGVGLDCYRNAYVASFIFSASALLLSLFTIAFARRRFLKQAELAGRLE